MKASSAFPSKYLKAGDLTEDRILVIDRYEIEDIGSGNDAEEKPILYFRGEKKGLVLNKTNSNIITKLYGDEMNDWIGKPIILYAAEVEFQGDIVPAIRVRAKKPEAAASPSLAIAVVAQRNTAMRSAWDQFKAAHSGIPADKLAEMWRNAFGLYFNGKSKDAVSELEWNKFATDGFNKSAPNPIVEAPFFDDADIPF